MFEYEIHFQVPGSGAGVIIEVVRANSDSQARCVIRLRYPKAQIFSSRRV